MSKWNSSHKITCGDGVNKIFNILGECIKRKVSAYIFQQWVIFLCKIGFQRVFWQYMIRSEVMFPTQQCVALLKCMSQRTWHPQHNLTAYLFSSTSILWTFSWRSAIFGVQSALYRDGHKSNSKNLINTKQTTWVNQKKKKYLNPKKYHNRFTNHRLLHLYKAAWIFYCGPQPRQRRQQQRSPRFFSIISNLVNFHFHTEFIITENTKKQIRGSKINL